MLKLVVADGSRNYIKGIYFCVLQLLLQSELTFLQYATHLYWKNFRSNLPGINHARHFCKWLERMRKKQGTKTAYKQGWKQHACSQKDMPPLLVFKNATFIKVGWKLQKETELAGYQGTRMLRKRAHLGQGTENLIISPSLSHIVCVIFFFIISQILFSLVQQLPSESIYAHCMYLNRKGQDYSFP